MYSDPRNCREWACFVSVNVLCLVLLVCFVFAGCQPANTKISGDPPPEWVTGRPDMNDMICAVGMSGPTFFTRKQLALTLSVEIRNIMLDISTSRGSTVDEATVIEVSSWASDSVVEGSEIMGYWYDGEGVVPDGRL